MANVQVVPDIESKTARIVVEIEDPASTSGHVTCEVREAKSGNPAGSAEATYTPVDGGAIVELRVPIAECRLWSPEDPFLYEAMISTAATRTTTRFGMRSFHFDAKTGRAMLNGRPYPMRGTNVCVYRFFEDPAARRSAVAGRVGATAPPGLSQHALELHPLLHRISAGDLVPRGRRRRSLDPGRVSDLVRRPMAQGADHRGTGPRVPRLDARAVEPSVRGDLGCAERIGHRPDRAGDPDAAQTRFVGPALGQRLVGGRRRGRCLRSASLCLLQPQFPPVGVCHVAGSAGCSRVP